MDLNLALLSRIQFGFTVGFHILFPTLNIGLAVFLCIMETVWLKTKNPVYLKICKFWTRIFALTFGMGVVSGIVLAYELGTNFGRLIETVGSILGPLFGYEVMSAFFLEAGFLGIMLFGWNRVGPRLHYFATLMVAIGTVISAFWIMSANSWMQTPAGYEIANNKFLVASWWEAIFNPSFMLRFIHMLMASFVTSVFVLAGVSGWYLLRKKNEDIAKPVFSFSLLAAFILVPIQIVVGDFVGVKMYAYQPLKTAAMEGNWETQQGAPLVLFGAPSEEDAKNRFELSIPYGASLFNTHDMHGTLVGLKSAPRSEWPVVAPVFYGFRIMVGIGLLFLAIASYGFVLWLRKRHYENRLLQRLCLWASPLGFVATIMGWIVAESGRQPWAVYGLMRTDAGTSLVPPAHVLISLILFIVVYGIIFAFYLYYLFKLIRKGPGIPAEDEIILGYIMHPQSKELD